MAPQSVAVIVGVDVCKDRLDLFEYHSERRYSISNDAAAIKARLDGLSVPVKLALEPTHRDHLELAEAAHARGHAAYLIDPYRLSQYRAGLGRRAKTDLQDAQLLARFLEREIRWPQWIERCQAIPGVGPLTAMAMVASWCRGPFRNADAYIAFLGLDVRVKQSGRWQGRCRLTKKGDGEVRRLLYNAAMQGRRRPQWEPYYVRLRERRMSSSAVRVALSRKLAKVSFALPQTGTPFVPAVPGSACVSTWNLSAPGHAVTSGGSWPVAGGATTCVACWWPWQD